MSFSAISNVNPTVSFDHIRRFEQHQIAEASKRRDEVKAIAKNINEILKRMKY